MRVDVEIYFDPKNGFCQNMYLPGGGEDGLLFTG